MLLADLCLQDLPDDALKSLIFGSKKELLRRSKLRALERRQKQRDSDNATCLSSYEKYCKEVHQLLPYEQAILTLASDNPATPYALPSSVRTSILEKRQWYLPCILAQDWTTLFPNADKTEAHFYVYAHIDPRKPPMALHGLSVVLQGRPFYIGKGSGNRAWDLKRNQGHDKRLDALREHGFSPGALVQILVGSLTEQQALILEAKLIYFFGSMYELNTKGCLFNLADHMRPTFAGSLRKVLSPQQYRRDLRKIIESRKAVDHSDIDSVISA